MQYEEGSVHVGDRIIIPRAEKIGNTNNVYEVVHLMENKVRIAWSLDKSITNDYLISEMHNMFQLKIWIYEKTL